MSLGIAQVISGVLHLYLSHILHHCVPIVIEMQKIHTILAGRVVLLLRLLFWVLLFRAIWIHCPAASICGVRIHESKAVFCNMCQSCLFYAASCSCRVCSVTDLLQIILLSLLSNLIDQFHWRSLSYARRGRHNERRKISIWMHTCSEVLDRLTGV